jgi:hypothetical protein
VQAPALKKNGYPHSSELTGWLEYAAPRSDLARLLADSLPLGTAPQEGWLTAYVDASSPRRGTDGVILVLRRQQGT